MSETDLHENEMLRLCECGIGRDLSVSHNLLYPRLNFQVVKAKDRAGYGGGSKNAETWRFERRGRDGSTGTKEKESGYRYNIYSAYL